MVLVRILMSKSGFEDEVLIKFILKSQRFSKFSFDLLVLATVAIVLDIIKI
jgi:hypothetical protein